MSDYLVEIRASVLNALLSASEFDAAMYPTIGMFQKAAMRATASISGTPILPPPF